MQKLVLIVIALVLMSGIAIAIEDEETASASVTVNEYLSITVTDAGANGINFGSLDPGAIDQPDNDQNAGVAAVTVTNDVISNVTVSVLKYGDNFSGGPITIDNVKYDEDNTKASPTTMPSSYTDTTIDLASGASQGFWYWIDIPSSTAAGTFTSTFYYKGDSTV